GFDLPAEPRQGGKESAPVLVKGGAVMVANKPRPLEALAYSPAQAAKVVGRSHTRIKKAIREKELTARKDGRATLIEHAELVRWLAALPTIGRKPEQETIEKPVAAKNASKSGARPVPPSASCLASPVANSRR